MSTIRALLFLALLPATGPLLAQTETPPLRLRAFLFGGGARSLYLRDGEEIKSLRASPIQPSAAIRIRGREVLELFDRPGPGDDGAPPSRVAAIRIPEGSTHLLLLVLVEEEDTRYVVMEDDLHRADARDWMFLNMTASAIVFQIGEDTEPVLIAPRSRFAHRAPSEAAGNLPVRAAARHEGEVELFYSTFWPMRPDRRTMVLFVPDGDRIRLRRIVEPVTPMESSP
jgi:hypothetical protein